MSISFNPGGIINVNGTNVHLDDLSIKSNNDGERYLTDSKNNQIKITVNDLIATYMCSCNNDSLKLSDYVQLHKKIIFFAKPNSGDNLNNVNELHRQIQQIAQIYNRKDEKGCTTLMGLLMKNELAVEDDLRKIKNAIKYGANVNDVDHEGNNAAFYLLSKKEICDTEIKILEILIENGLDIRTTNKNGESLLFFISQFGSKNKKKLTETINNASQFEKIKSEYKSYIKIKSIGHAFSLGGLVAAPNDHDDKNSDINLTGGLQNYWLKKMAKATYEMSSNKYSEFMNEELKQMLEESLNFAVGTPDPQETLERVKKGLPTIIKTGFKGHACTVLLFGSYFALCNRGGESRNQVEVFKYNPDKINQDLLNKMKGNLSIESYKKFYFEDLPSELQFQKDSLSKEIQQESHFLAYQTVGNCSYFSPSTAIWAMLTLQTAKNSDPSERKNNYKNSNYHYTCWATFNKLYHFERILGVHQARTLEPKKVSNIKTSQTANLLISPLFAAKSDLEKIKKVQFIQNAVLQNDIDVLLDYFNQLPRSDKAAEEEAKSSMHIVPASDPNINMGYIAALLETPPNWQKIHGYIQAGVNLNYPGSLLHLFNQERPNLEVIQYLIDNGQNLDDEFPSNKPISFLLNVLLPFIFNSALQIEDHLKLFDLILKNDPTLQTTILYLKEQIVNHTTMSSVLKEKLNNILNQHSTFQV